MTLDSYSQQPGARLLFVMACLVVIGAGLRVAAPILVPFVLALFIAVVSMPLMFGIFMFSFPSGLVLYFSINNTLTILQQWIIYRKKDEMPVPART